MISSLNCIFIFQAFIQAGLLTDTKQIRKLACKALYVPERVSRCMLLAVAAHYLLSILDTWKTWFYLLSLFNSNFLYPFLSTRSGTFLGASLSEMHTIDFYCNFI